MQRPKFITALIQLAVVKDKSVNIRNADAKIQEAAMNGAKLVALPECFNSPYGVNFFVKFAEVIPNGLTCQMLSESAKNHSIYLVGGTIPEVDEGKYYNTCTIWNPKGQLIGKYRKLHLFDVLIPDGITFKESEVFCAGNHLVTFDLKIDAMDKSFIADFKEQKVEGHDVHPIHNEFQESICKIGIGICYDLRFEELAKVYRLIGCDMLLYPGSFNMTTGPLHWELIQRARAVDNQVYVCGISPARNIQGYISWGHSQCTNPWGRVIHQAGIGEEIVYCEIDIDECERIREQIPTFRQRRIDIYDTIIHKEGQTLE